MQRRKWRQFSLRFPLGIVTLVCLLLGLWNVCQHRAESDVSVAAGGRQPTTIAPYLLGVEHSNNITVVETYHIWFFGLTCDLPYSRQFPEIGGMTSIVRPRIIFQQAEPELLPLPGA